MKALFLAAVLMSSVAVVPASAVAGVDISIGISLPPPVVFAAPPEVVVMPDASDVYFVPDIDEDLFFWNGWWWRPWEGHWYRSRYYDRGWAYYRTVPSFYFDVDPGWRGYYRSRDWYGHRWVYQRVPYQQLQRNWKSWHNSGRWERHGTWGVLNYRPRSAQKRQELRMERRNQYRHGPEGRQLKNQPHPEPRNQPQIRQYQHQPQSGQQYQLHDRRYQNQPSSEQRYQPHVEQHQNRQLPQQGHHGKVEKGDAGHGAVSPHEGKRER